MRIKIRAMLAAVALAVSIVGLALEAARADQSPAEQNLTQREFQRITAIEPEDKNAPPVAAPVAIHNLTDAEHAEMDRMHAVRLLKGKEWKRLSPQERDERVRAIRAQMPGVSLALTVPQGELWAIPPGEDSVNFHNILQRHTIRLWTSEEQAAMPVAVGNGPTSADRGGRRDAPLQLAVKFTF